MASVTDLKSAGFGMARFEPVAFLICQYEHAYETWGGGGGKEEVQTVYYKIICISSTMPIRPNRSHYPVLVVIIECVWGD